MPAAILLAVLLVVTALTGCGYSAEEPPRGSATSVVTPPLTPAERSVAAVRSSTPVRIPSRAASQVGAFPQALVGTWISSSGGAEIVYQFTADGSYKYAGVLLQRRPSGMFSFTVGEAGSASVDGSELLLEPRMATKSMEDPDSPSSSYKDRPDDLVPKRLSWQLDAAHTTLSLTDDTGLTVGYERQ